ncbi:hypothetical protein BCR43DRAFT_486084 [Syncephalastrum racemosum]|uniref:HMG box domain-containing protein n=1 Tax=Syncephalastrum racemosum TaxID=13706 RepID=A0A1X2HNH8_SYNRA|nr:hypothetical protein BCR43DRAFT_486084 [Syncephalastrum racemosum]
MVAMGVKRGHRRLIQREIATSKGVPRSQPLVLNSLETKSSAMFYRPESSQAGDIESAEQGNGNSSTSTSGYGSMPSSASNRLSVSTGSGSCGSSVPTDMSGSNGTSASSGSGSMSSSSSSGGTSRKQSTVTNASNATSGSGNSSASNMSSDATSLTTPNTDGANNLKSKLVPPAPVANALNIARSAGDVGLSSTEDDDTASSATTANTSNGNSNRNSGGSGSNGDGISVHQPKRKYRRHPKRDKNAPVKPPSAYIMFSNHARAQMKEHNMSFADMAKSVGDQWKNLSQEEKQKYERTAMQAKDEYLVELEQYRKTPEYHKYQEYLKDFKHKQEAANRLISRARRRAHKNVGSPSSGSLADSSSNGGNGNGSNGSSSASSGGTDSLRPQSDDASTNTGESSTTSADGRLDQRDELLSNDARAAMQQQVFLVKPPPKQDKARPPVVCDSSVWFECCSSIRSMFVNTALM